MQKGLWQCVSEMVNLVQSWSHSQNFKNLVYRTSYSLLFARLKQWNKTCSRKYLHVVLNLWNMIISPSANANTSFSLSSKSFIKILLLHFLGFLPFFFCFCMSDVILVFVD